MVGLEEEGDPLLFSALEEKEEREISSWLPQKKEEEDEAEQQVLVRSKSGLQRCKTAPAMDMGAVLRDLKLLAEKTKQKENPMEESSESESSTSAAGLVRQAGLLLLLYLTMGVLVYSLNRDHFSGVETHPVVDALYFCIVTMCTIGYGDITPLTPSTKLFACLFVLVGFGFIDILLSGVVNHVLDLQERNIISDIIRSTSSRSRTFNQLENRNHLLVDINKGRMRIRLKVGLALSVVVLCIGVGAIVLHLLEGLSWIDCFYLSALSVTTVGYGDRAFNTLPGRLFAAIWLLFSTLAVARAFLYLVEARIDKRQRTLAKWVLQRDITPHDLMAANINNNDFISKSEYVLFKLKEMGKIGEHDVTQICHQFKRLDPNNSGRITLTDLLQKHS